MKESQAAYQAFGCEHAEEIIPWIADEEPYDVQLEYVISQNKCIIGDCTAQKELTDNMNR